MLHTLLIHKVIIIDLYTGIDNSNHVQSLFMQIFCHLLRMRETLRIPGEAAVSIHIVNIQPDTITWMMALSQFGGKLAYLFLSFVVPTALMMTNSPAWW